MIIGQSNSFFNSVFHTVKDELRYAFKSLLHPEIKRSDFFRNEMMRSTAELMARPHAQTKLQVV